MDDADLRGGGVVYFCPDWLLRKHGKNDLRNLGGLEMKEAWWEKYMDEDGNYTGPCEPSRCDLCCNIICTCAMEAEYQEDRFGERPRIRDKEE